jgi:hypothetical protein
MNEHLTQVARTSDDLDHFNTLIIRRDSKISFILYTEAELDVWDDRPFQIEGPGFSLKGRTDREGKFEHGPVGFAEYDLFVDQACFRIPTTTLDAPPHPVHVPNWLLQDVRTAWKQPEPEELSDAEA